MANWPVTMRTSTSSTMATGTAATARGTAALSVESAATLEQREIVVLRAALQNAQEARRQLQREIEDEKWAHAMTSRRLTHAVEEAKQLRAELTERRTNPFVTVSDNIALKQALADSQMRLEQEQARSAQLAHEMHALTNSRTPDAAMPAKLVRQLQILRQLLEEQENIMNECDGMLNNSTAVHHYRHAQLLVSERTLIPPLEQVEEEIHWMQQAINSSPNEEERAKMIMRINYISKRQAELVKKLASVRSQKKTTLAAMNRADVKIKKARKTLLSHDAPVPANPKNATATSTALSAPSRTISIDTAAATTTTASSQQSHMPSQPPPPAYDRSLSLSAPTQDGISRASSSMYSNSHNGSDDEDEDSAEGRDSTMTSVPRNCDLGSQTGDKRSMRNGKDGKDDFSGKVLAKEVVALARARDDLVNAFTVVLSGRADFLPKTQHVISVMLTILAGGDNGVDDGQSIASPTTNPAVVAEETGAVVKMPLTESSLREELQSTKAMLTEYMRMAQDVRDRYLEGYLKTYNDRVLERERERFTRVLVELAEAGREEGKLIISLSQVESTLRESRAQLEHLGVKQDVFALEEESAGESSYVQALQRSLTAANNSISYLGQLLDKKHQRLVAAESQLASMENRLVERLGTEALQRALELPPVKRNTNRSLSTASLPKSEVFLRPTDLATAHALSCGSSPRLISSNGPDTPESPPSAKPVDVSTVASATTDSKPVSSGFWSWFF